MAANGAASLSGLEKVIAERGGEVTAPGTWPPVLGHAPWVEQVWTNYLGNALKHGGASPCLELGATEEQGLVRFWIRDDGQPLTPGEITQLFQPFSRLAGAHTDGHGLGLSIVRRLVEKLGGTVGVAPCGSQGNTFSFSLPRAGR